MSTDTTHEIMIDRSIGDFRYDIDYEFDAGSGLSEQTIDYICDVKNDPDWIREFRKDAYRKFVQNRVVRFQHSQLKDFTPFLFSSRKAVIDRSGGEFARNS